MQNILQTKRGFRCAYPDVGQRNIELMVSVLHFRLSEQQNFYVGAYGYEWRNQKFLFVS